MIVESPCYGSAIELAHSTGADVSLWQRRYEDGWAHDLDELERLLRPETKLVYINSPHNPTGTQMLMATLARLVELLAERSIVLFSDEVYRGSSTTPPRASRPPATLYSRAISLNTVSKAYGLPGLRIGWLACREPALLERITDSSSTRRSARVPPANCSSRSRCATARSSWNAAAGSCSPTCRWSTIC